ncbi:MAG: hypothetical protein IPH26_10265 [Sterolibacteriaceae bacterium]|uniref:Uncharacterized protein n=1 Tax=Candidatus Methylophosphatis roskildensis TaxID=2899263 RepID=A0A9D7E3T9_9PROT|nr:hypothetical protein [Candidatus Methylophosphatis roskildensis]MBK7236780.1 hypothetical protein [Sterolibacteriaceae bacterium]
MLKNPNKRKVFPGAISLSPQWRAAQRTPVTMHEFGVSDLRSAIAVSALPEQGALSTTVFLLRECDRRDRRNDSPEKEYIGA